jgi:hypothetical protein
MKKGPFKMKGYSYPGISPVKRTEDHSKVVDVTVGSEMKGIGSEDTSVEKSFESVESLKKAGAPSEVIQREYDKQLELWKEQNI